MSRPRPPHFDSHARRRDSEESSQRRSPSSEIVRVGQGDDPLVQALVGNERESNPPADDSRELSPESLALLLDRLDGIVEDNDGGGPHGAPSSSSRSGIVARPRRGQPLSLRIALAAAAGMLTAGIALLWTPESVPQRGRVEGRAVPQGESDVRRVDLPAAPAPDTEPLPPSSAASPESTLGGATPVAAATGRVTVRREAGPAEMFLRGRSLGRVPATLELRPGRHDLLVRTPEGVSYYRTVRIRAGETAELVLP